MGEQDGGPIDRSAEFERALVDQENQTYHLRLYVAGLSPRSRSAIATIRAVFRITWPKRH